MSFFKTAAVYGVIAASITVGIDTVGAHKNKPHKNEAKAFSFALWGDMPYAKNGDGLKIDKLIDDINASDVAFSVFDGDIKAGSSYCDDWQYTEALIPKMYVGPTEK